MFLCNLSFASGVRNGLRASAVVGVTEMMVKMYCKWFVFFFLVTVMEREINELSILLENKLISNELTVDYTTESLCRYIYLVLAWIEVRSCARCIIYNIRYYEESSKDIFIIVLAWT
jgi:hypothetical protein